MKNFNFNLITKRALFIILSFTILSCGKTSTESDTATGIHARKLKQIKKTEKEKPTPLGDTGTTPLGDTGTTPLGDTGTTPLGDTGTTPLGDTGTTPLGDTGTTPLGDTGITPVNPPAIPPVNDEKQNQTNQAPKNENPQLNDTNIKQKTKEEKEKENETLKQLKNSLNNRFIDKTTDEQKDVMKEFEANNFTSIDKKCFTFAKKKITLLEFAMKNKDPKLIKLCLNNGSNVNIKYSEGNTPLHDYMLNEAPKDPEIVKLLIEKSADLDTPDKDNRMALHMAVMNKDKKAVDMILKRTNKINTKNIQGGLTSLCIAAKYGYTEIAQKLINNKAELNICSKFGASPLYLAARSGHTEMVKLLIKNKANAKLYTDRKNTLLHAVANGGHTEIAKILIDIDVINIDCQNKGGNTPLHIAITQGHTEMVKLLIERGAKVNVPNNKGNTPLHQAAKLQWRDKISKAYNIISKAYNIKKEIVDLLSKEASEADFLVKNKDGKMPENLLTMMDIDSKILFSIN